MLLFLPFLFPKGFVQQVENFQLTSSMGKAFAIAMISPAKDGGAQKTWSPSGF